MAKRYDYIQVFDWMTAVYDLKGNALLTYAYIYNLVEVTPQELEVAMNVPKGHLIRALKSLEDDGLIKYRKQGDKTYFYASPEFCL